MPHRSSQKWIEAQHTAGFITRVWLWVLGALGALLAFAGLVYWAIPALFFWLVFGFLLGG